MINYKNKNIIIIGLGRTGLSCINFFISRGIIPRVMDTRIYPPNLKMLPPFIESCLGSLNSQWLYTADLIVISPGIDIIKHDLLREAIFAGIEIISDIELFCREVKKPILAITGTNGKSTVATMIAAIANYCGIITGLGGNIGQPVLNLLQKSYQLYVLELSSFQLETTFSLHAAAATVLNINEDHGDRYLSKNDYCSVKCKIYKNADICIFNADNKYTKPKLFGHQYISFGINKGDYHLNFQKENIWLQKHGKNILNTKEMKLIGQHNYTNSLAVLAFADVLRLPRTASLHIIKNFTGLPHCFQMVWENNGIRWINDSKSTNVSSTIAALQITRMIIQGTIYLLLGGIGKSANFKSLINYLQGDNIKIYCFGHDGYRLNLLRPDISIITNSMDEAIKCIAKKVVSGDIVLLSPACSSLDHYYNFAHRGNVFTKLAKKFG
ncbi:MAG: UDP-N-acetylmuramoyl-L-alanine--D-glutamate ligase [Candidatus Dasytiphilus stammeri]